MAHYQTFHISLQSIEFYYFQVTYHLEIYHCIAHHPTRTLMLWDLNILNKQIHTCLHIILIRHYIISSICSFCLCWGANSFFFLPFIYGIRQFTPYLGSKHLNIMEQFTGLFALLYSHLGQLAQWFQVRCSQICLSSPSGSLLPLPHCPWKQIRYWWHLVSIFSINTISPLEDSSAYMPRCSPILRHQVSPLHNMF